MTEKKNSSETTMLQPDETEQVIVESAVDYPADNDKTVQTSKSKKRKSKLNLDLYIKKAGVYYKVLKKVPFVLLGTRIKARKQNYVNLQKQLNQARIPVSHEMYISNAIFYSILAGILGAFLGLFLTYIIIELVGLPDKLTKLTFSPSIAFLLSYKEIFIAFFITIVFIVGLGGLVYNIFMIYPGFQAGERKSKIDMQLPYAVTFMYALSKGGMNILDVFRALAKSEDTYGEASKEIDAIVRDMDYFGHDLRTALTNASETTPSDRFQDLIYNLLTVIDSGGNIPNYFRDKSEQYLVRSEVDQKGFLDTLALLAESYVTAFVAGPLFIIIMGVMMAVMGSGTSTMVYAIIYAVLPVGSLMFVVMISIITPTEMGEPKLLNTRMVLDHGIPEVPGYLLPVYDENGEPVGETQEKARERDYFESFIKSKKWLAIKNILKNPLAPMFRNPLATIAVTVPLALLVVGVPLMMNIHSLTTPALLVDFIDDKLVFAILLVIIPLSIFFEIKSMKKKKLESNFPDFLKKLASTNETGMTLRDSIKLMAKSETDALSREVKKIWHDMLWGIDINDSLVRFANRLRTQVITRSLSLITKANESSGDVGEVLIVAARDAASEQGMRRERSMSMMIYIVIIYISFLVFVGVIYVISTTFLTEMAAAGKQMAASGGQGGFLGNFDLNAYTQLFKHAAIIQGLSSGLMAGAMGEGSVMAGLKHSTIMIIIGYVIFTLFI
ncbi:MAG: type II secretion system F family protein [Methanolobus sp.]|uniref:type II secretion system F family protein n=1 Tax=Methanolobus sp. TaxID=1874737 RepID=UPI00272FDAE5|nr:type II secretion system F family protein [Methanolobus sp.]MDP2216085.1 type II secretion system F family protein [Methanolobus sp.]